MHEKAKHEQQTVANSSVKADKVRRPTITGGGSSEDWQYFVTRWEEYAAATKLSESDKVLQLLECCDEGTSLMLQEEHYLQSQKTK